jgi:hypothetical protein
LSLEIVGGLTKTLKENTHGEELKMDGGSELAVIGESGVASAAQVKAQADLIMEVMLGVMKKDMHYGTIPGCGPKPTLLKPGAEKLMATFKLAADPQIEEIPTDDGITFRIVCRLTYIPTGLFVGSGVGECSTKEEKYNWQKAACDEEFNATPEDRRRLKWKAGYGNKKAYSIKQVRTNPADQANTVLKMAKKRALVDGTLTALAASDCFTQDIEDMPKGDKGKNAPKNKPTGKAGSVKEKPKGKSGDDPKMALKKALFDLCDGDEEGMKKTLKACSEFDTDEGKKFIDGSEGIEKASPKWCGSTLGKVRKLIEEKAAAAAEPEPTGAPEEAGREPAEEEEGEW